MCVVEGNSKLYQRGALTIFYFFFSLEPEGNCRVYRIGAPNFVLKSFSKCIFYVAIDTCTKKNKNPQCVLPTNISMLQILLCEFGLGAS